MTRARSKNKENIALLEDLALRLGVRLRYEKTASRGGLCRHRGTYHIIIDSKATDALKLELLRESLGKFDLSGLFLSPKVRDILDEA